MATGKVKWFNNAKGYGFILPESGEGDLFVHYSSVEMDGYKTLKAGQDVEFDVQEGPKGYHAVNIRSPDSATLDAGLTEDADTTDPEEASGSAAEASDSAAADSDTSGSDASDPEESADESPPASVTVEDVDVMSTRDTPPPTGQVPREGAGSA